MNVSAKCWVTEWNGWMDTPKTVMTTRAPAVLTTENWIYLWNLLGNLYNFLFVTSFVYSSFNRLLVEPPATMWLSSWTGTSGHKAQGKIYLMILQQIVTLYFFVIWLRKGNIIQAQGLLYQCIDQRNAAIFVCPNKISISKDSLFWL